MIDNNYVGAWKTVSIFSPLLNSSNLYIVEDATETGSQDVQPKKLVQGTVLPRVLSIGGSTGEISVSAPLLIFDEGRTNINDISDGLKLWYDLFNTTMLSPTFQMNPGFILSSAKLSLDAEAGAKYTLSLKGDASALASEGGPTDWFTLYDGGDPFPGDVPIRVATFYDIVGSIGNPPIAGLMQSLNIEVSFTTDGFNYIGQDNQNKVWGVSSASIKFDGTMISSQRSPVQGDFAWQDLLEMPDSNGGPGGTGGVATSVEGGIDLYLRQGVTNILPGIDLTDVVFERSSLNINPGFLKSQFSGQAWITTQTI